MAVEGDLLPAGGTTESAAVDGEEAALVGFTGDSPGVATGGPPGTGEGPDITIGGPPGIGEGETITDPPATGEGLGVTIGGPPGTGLLLIVQAT